MDLLEFAEGDRKLSPTETWFEEHPEITKEVLKGLKKGAPIKTTARWLRQYKAFPYGPDAFRGWLTKQGFILG